MMESFSAKAYTTSRKPFGEPTFSPGRGPSCRQQRRPAWLPGYYGARTEGDDPIGYAMSLPAPASCVTSRKSATLDSVESWLKGANPQAFHYWYRARTNTADRIEIEYSRPLNPTYLSSVAAVQKEVGPACSSLIPRSHCRLDFLPGRRATPSFAANDLRPIRVHCSLASASCPTPSRDSCQRPVLPLRVNSRQLAASKTAQFTPGLQNIGDSIENGLH